MSKQNFAFPTSLPRSPNADELLAQEASAAPPPAAPKPSPRKPAASATVPTTARPNTRAVEGLALVEAPTPLPSNDLFERTSEMSSRVRNTARRRVSLTADQRTRMTNYIPSDIARRVRKACVDYECSDSHFMTEAARALLDRLGK